MSGKKGMKRKKVEYIPYPAKVDGTEHWRTWAQIAEVLNQESRARDIITYTSRDGTPIKLTQQMLCRLGTGALKKIAKELIDTVGPGPMPLGGSMAADSPDPERVHLIIHDINFLEAVEDKLRCRKRETDS